MLEQIDQRLWSILIINKPFGVINIIMFGEFFQFLLVLSITLYDTFDDILTKYPCAIEVLFITFILEALKLYELIEIMWKKIYKQFTIMYK